MICKQCRGETANLGKICTPCLNGRALVMNTPKPPETVKPSEFEPEKIVSAGPFSHGTGGGKHVIKSMRYAGG